MKSILPLTATFTWSPSNYPSCEPLLASGTVAGALDENFSNDAQVQIWKPDYAGGRRGGNPQRLAGINTSARFNRLAWGYVNPNRPQGLLAAGLENGELNVWDASKLISSSDSSSSSLLRNTTHTGPIKGLDFNSINSHLLGSGGPSGEIYVWDLNSPAKPYSPGAKSSKLDEITSLQWNKQVPQVLATGSNSGYTVIWDLKSKKEVASLQFGGSQGGGPPGISLNGNGTAGRRIMGPVAWHPDTPTRIITASCDDHEDPVILQWDLRNWLTPESILRGHTAGILGLSWSQSDSDLLVSCGKDNRTIFWNPRLGSCIGELPSATNWCFEAQLSPKNQNLLAVASFDGKIGIHDLQNTNSEFRQDEEADKEAEAAAAAASAQNDEDDIFNLPSAAALTAAAAPATKGTSLAQPPKWLKRPVSATFGFGGQLVSTTNVPLASDAPVGKNKPKPVQSTQINVRDVVTEPEIVSRAKRLQEALENGTLADFCAEKARENEKGEGASNGPTTIGGRPDEGPNWKALSTLFHADSKDELIALLGFNKEDVKDKVSKAIEKFKLGTNAAATGMLEATTTGAAAKAAATSGSSVGGATAGSTAQSISSDGPVPQGGEPTVSFASEPSESVTTTTTEVSTDEIDGEAAKLSSATSTSAGAPSESETTEPSLFGEDVPGQPNEAHAAFFNSISGESGAGVRSALPERVLVPHNNIAPGSSVAATIGSPGPSSVGGGSETMTGLGGAKTDEGEHEGSITSVRPEATTFRIYPADESDADKLITRALVLGDFASAVSLCISTDRFADALLLAVRGGPDLLATTQKAYFEKRTTSLPYLRLFQSIVSDDLVDVVQNADLSEWEEIFVVLCTFAKGEEFANLVEQLGQRLEFKYKSASAAEKEGGSLNGHSEETNGTVVPLSVKAKTFREHAVLCYLGAGRLERVAALWIDEMREEEAALRASMASSISSGSETEASSLYSAHASALQTFMEKITVFQHASSYVDEDLANPTQSSEAAESGARSYKLAALYDRTHEYIELLADQGLIATALKYVDQTPQDYRVSRNGKQGIESAASTRERLVRADAARSNGRGVAAASVAPIAPASTASSSYGPTSTNAYGAPQSNYSQNAYGATSTYGVPSQQYGSSQQNSSGYGAQPASVPSIPVIPPVPNVLDPYAQQPASANSAYGPSDPYSSTPSPYAPSGNAGSAYGAPPQGSIASSSTPTAATLPPPPPAKKEPVSGWNDVPDLQPIRRTTSAMGNKAAPITSPFPNSSAAASPSPYNTGLPPSQGSLPPPPPRGPTPGGVTAGGAAGNLPPPPPRGSFASPPPNNQQGYAGPPRPSVGQAPMAGNGIGMNQQQPGPGGGFQSRPPPPAGPPGARGPGPNQQQQQSGPYGPVPGQQGPPQNQQQQFRPPPPQQQQNQQQPPPPPRNAQPSPAPGPYGPNPNVGGGGAPPLPGQGQVQGQGRGMPPQGGMSLPTQPPPRIGTPGAGAGAPVRSATPSKPASKYPPGDRSHIPEAQKPIFNCLSRELARLKSTAPPGQRRMVEDTERRLNILFDALNCGTVDEKLLGGLSQLVGAVDARNQQAALSIHLQLASSASGELGAAMVGIKMIISRMQQ